MPLFAVNDSSNPIAKVPYASQFAAWKARLTTTEQQAIHDELARRIQAKVAAGEDIMTAGWLPSEFPNGSQDWSQTAFEVIYNACHQSSQQTAQCFGLFVWEHMMNYTSDDWHFMKCELNSVPIESMTYFRCRTPHP